jgi:hypothetical protein
MAGDYREQIAELLRLSKDVEQGPEQVSLCEQAVNLADEHRDLDAGFVTRRRLIQSSTFSGMPDKSMVAFAWCLAQCDRDPQRFPEQRVLWQYKWVVMSLYGFPEIPRHKIDDATADIEMRYERSGLSLRPIWRIRLISARGMGDREDADTYLDKWLAAPRDRFTDCRACETSTHVGYLIDQGKDEEAMAAAAPLLNGQLSCATQPQITLGRVLLPLVRMGRPAQAAPLHLRGYRDITRKPHYFTTTIAQHLVYLTLTGNLGRALAAFERYLEFGLTDRTPSDRFHFFLSCRFVLDRLRRDGRARVEMRLPRSFPAYQETGDYEVEALIDWFDGQLGELATQFNARNGNDHFSTMIGRHHDLADHSHEYPLGR